MRLQVVAQVGLVPEALGALRTGEGPLRVVGSLVLAERQQRREPPPAGAALERALVAALVLPQLGLLEEALPALPALVGLLAQVAALVLLQRRHGGEALPADVAREARLGI